MGIFESKRLLYQKIFIILLCRHVELIRWFTVWCQCIEGIRQGTLEIVIEEVLWSIRGSYQTIWSFPLTNVKWHSVTWPYTITTPYWSDFVPNSTFYRILSCFHRTFVTGVACRQGMLTPPDIWSRPFGTFICSTCWDQSFFRTCRYFYGLFSSNIPRYFLDFAYNGRKLRFESKSLFPENMGRETSYRCVIEYFVEFLYRCCHFACINFLLV